MTDGLRTWFLFYQTWTVVFPRQVPFLNRLCPKDSAGTVAKTWGN